MEDFGREGNGRSTWQLIWVQDFLSVIRSLKFQTISRILSHEVCVTRSRQKLIFLQSIRMYIGFKTSFYVVWYLDSTASYLLTGLHLGFFRSWPSLYLPSSFSSVFLVLSFVSASTSMLFWVNFLLPFFEHSICLLNTVIPRLTSDPANEFFGKRRYFSLFFSDSADEYGFG